MSPRGPRRVSDRKDLSIARLLSRVRLDSFLGILSALQEGIMALDTDLRIMTMNAAAERILGRNRHDLTGVPVCDLFGQKGCPRDTLQAALLSGQPIIDFQTTVALADGRQGHVLLRTAPLEDRDGTPLGLALIMGDVTEVTTLRQQISRRYHLGRMVGRDPRMQELFGLIRDVAGSDASVLIRGESGTGKELVARAIHETGDRAGGPFVQVNCSALSESLLESELFGHVKGAYTGAVADRRGRFEEADGGTIFLDEIGDVSPVVQVKLLRVLQERTIERVGDNKQIRVNVRVVSATNRDLESLLAGGRMREDFFYRIKVVSLAIPPLRDRREDIPLLVANFLERWARREGRGKPAVIAGDAMELLMNHRWPGNVRELENALEHALVLSRGRTIRADHLPPETRQPGHRSAAGLRAVARDSAEEKEVLAEALAATGWNRTRAARRLGIDRSTLWRKIKLHGLEPPE
ncbi:MAG: sigma-54 interaction domain-containing protein [Candidatus Krumholzibacteriia bacterium]